MAKTGLEKALLSPSVVYTVGSQWDNKVIGYAQIVQRIRFGCLRQGCLVGCNERTSTIDRTTLVHV